MAARKYALVEQNTTSCQPPAHPLTKKNAPTTNPVSEKSTPSADPLPTHYQSTTNPLPENAPPSYGNGIGLWEMGKNKEIPIGFKGGAGEIFSHSKIPEQASSFCFVDSAEDNINHEKLGIETAKHDIKQSTAEIDTMLEFQPITKGDHNGQSTINNELRNYGLVSEDSLEDGNEGDDSELFNPGGD